MNCCIKKKSIALIMSMMLIILLLSLFTDQAEAEVCDDYYYEILDDGTVMILSYKGSDEEISIPVELNGHQVSIIGYGAFRKNTFVRKVIIAEGVLIIEARVFDGCSNLEDVLIPESVESIGFGAFDYCSSLEDISIPESVKSIGMGAFDGTALLENQTGDVKYADNWVVGCNEDITSVVIEKGTVGIADGAFDNGDYNRLVDITIPEGVKYIGASAFASNSDLEEITFPKSLVSIGDDAFWWCTRLKEVSIPENVAYIGKRAFCPIQNSISVDTNNDYYSSRDGMLYDADMTELIYCPTQIETVIVPEGVTSIASQAFYHFGSGNIILPESLSSIGACAFEESWVKSISIPDNVNSIGYGAFYNANGLESIKLPNGLVSIPNSMFFLCANLTSTVIPGSVTDIEGSAFAYCFSLESVVIEEGIESIGYDAFRGCKSLGEVVLPNSVKQIGEYAFSGCKSLGEVVLPNSVKQIGEYAFSGCESLESVDLSDNIMYMGTNAFGGTPFITEQKDAIKYAGNWVVGSEIDIVQAELKEGIVGIANRAFEDCTDLKIITIPRGLQYIGDYAFSGCSSITEIVLPDEVTYIGEYAFSGCSSLEKINIPQGVSSIEQHTFEDCSNLVEVSISNGVTSIGQNAFLGCKNLEQITIPRSVISIDSVAFQNCRNLAKIDVEGSILSMGRHSLLRTAYYEESSNWINGTLYIGGCLYEVDENVSTCIVENGTVSIAESALFGCEKITKIVIPGSIKSISARAFDGSSVQVIGYIGDLESWGEIDINPYNETLYAAEIIYLSQIDDNGVSGLVPTNLVIDGVKLIAEKISVSDIITEDNNLFDIENASVYDIYLEKNGTKVNIDTTVTISLPVPEGQSGSDCMVVYIDEKGKITNIDSVYMEGYMVFDTDHFSYYAVVEKLPENKYILGDVTGDGKVTSVDARQVLQAAAGNRDLDVYVEAADVNGDGKVTSIDARWILQAAAGNRVL